MIPENFNIRVYGLLIREQQVLLADELISGNAMTKFPGGGLEFGESIKECLIREFDEELSIEIELDELFYINDFFQPSAFNPKDQLISIYFTVKQVGNKTIPVAKRPFAFPPHINQCFRWMELDKLRQMDLTYPIDQKVGELLREKYL